MNIKLLHLLNALFLAVLFTSCIKDEEKIEVFHYSEADLSTLQKTLNLPAEPENYTLKIPSHLGGATVSADDARATLGRVLFYDKKLSANNSVSCASCHKADKAFADDVAFSEGFEGKVTERNSLALAAFPSFNAYYGFGSGSRLFWDERASSVEEQAEQTLRNPIEMGMDMKELGDKLLKEDYYRILFQKAFPNQSNWTPERKILAAIQSFVNSIGCFNTAYDEGLSRTRNPDVDFPNFSFQQNLGKELFNQNCASCHNLGAGFSTVVTVANNGLDIDYEDTGVAMVTFKQSDEGVFKVPMLRNIALTAPYMHDGRFATLEEVVEHYSTGVKHHFNLHENLMQKSGDVLTPKKLNLSPTEKEALVAFLHTLTDQESISQEKYLNPFK